MTHTAVSGDSCSQFDLSIRVHLSPVEQKRDGNQAGFRTDKNSWVGGFWGLITEGWLEKLWKDFASRRLEDAWFICHSPAGMRGNYSTKKRGMVEGREDGFHVATWPTAVSGSWRARSTMMVESSWPWKQLLQSTVNSTYPSSIELSEYLNPPRASYHAPPLKPAPNVGRLTRQDPSVERSNMMCKDLATFLS